MLANDSRYNNADRVFADSHVYDINGQIITSTDDNGVSLDSPKVSSNSTMYLMTVGSPESLPPYKYMMKVTDDVTGLAYKALQDPTKWWVIADVNPQLGYPLDWKMGDLVNLPE